jgi:hypothetical protein
MPRQASHRLLAPSFEPAETQGTKRGFGNGDGGTARPITRRYRNV